MAANTDLLKKLSRRWVGQIGSGGVADADVTTIPLSSTTNLPTDTAVVATINRVDSSGTATPSLEETIIGVVSGSNLVTCTRGVEGTAQAHSAGAVVEILVTAKGWNDLVDMLLVQHNQLGLHTNITASNINASGTLTATSTSVLSHISASDVSARLVTACDITFNNNDPNFAVSTGNIKVGGADPWRTVSLFGGLKPTTTAGCAAKTTVEAGTNDIDYEVLAFDKTTDENAFVNFQMPDSYAGGAIQFRYVWTASGGGAADTLTMELSGIGLGNDDAIDQAVGTAVELADTWIADGDVHTSAWSGDVTLANTPVAGDWVHFELMRDVSEDDLDTDALIMEVQIRFKQGQYSD